MFNTMTGDVQMSLYNVETGEELGKLNGLHDITLETNTLYESRYNKENHEIGSLYNGGNCEMSFSCDTTSMNIDQLFGIDKATKPDAYDISFLKYVQCRKHKQKRINKKYAKKYGYKTIVAKSKGWQINTYADSTFEFKKDIV